MHSSWGTKTKTKAVGIMKQPTATMKMQPILAGVSGLRPVKRRYKRPGRM